MLETEPYLSFDVFQWYCFVITASSDDRHYLSKTLILIRSTRTLRNPRSICIGSCPFSSPNQCSSSSVCFHLWGPLVGNACQYFTILGHRVSILKRVNRPGVLHAQGYPLLSTNPQTDEWLHAGMISVRNMAPSNNSLWFYWLCDNIINGINKLQAQVCRIFRSHVYNQMCPIRRRDIQSIVKKVEFNSQPRWIG